MYHYALLEHISLKVWFHRSAATGVIKGGVNMKRIKSACIFQTLVFSQKPEMGYSKERALQLNREEFENYKRSLEKAHTRYQVTNVCEQDNGSLVIHVRKQYSDTADVREYFE